MFAGESPLQFAVCVRHIRAGSQNIAKAQLVFLAADFDEVQVMRPATRPIPTDAPCVPRRNVVSECRPPEAIIAMRLQSRRNYRFAALHVGDLDDHIDDGFDRQARHGGRAVI